MAPFARGAVVLDVDVVDVVDVVVVAAWLPGQNTPDTTGMAWATSELAEPTSGTAMGSPVTFAVAVDTPLKVRPAASRVAVAARVLSPETLIPPGNPL